MVRLHATVVVGTVIIPAKNRQVYVKNETKGTSPSKNRDKRKVPKGEIYVKIDFMEYRFDKCSAHLGF